MKEMFMQYERFWKEWKYGIIEGFVVGLVLMLLIVPFVNFANILLSLSILFVVFMIYQKVNPKTVSKKSVRIAKVCPECGSSRRHRKECSRGKKK